jgi:ABC-type nitrate/sulfonate/bicarbonate transport system ATPase subunit
MVFQDSALFAWRTVEENIRLPLELMNLTSTKDEIENLLDKRLVPEPVRAFNTAL